MKVMHIEWDAFYRLLTVDILGAQCDPTHTRIMLPSFG